MVKLMKRCFKCSRELPVEAFYANPTMADGHLGKCKECTRNDVAANRLLHIERARRYEKERSKLPRAIAIAAAAQAKWKNKFPAKRHAHSLLGSAVKCGRVTPWPVCAVPECASKPEAHHPDYSLPLDVVWLCKMHHTQAHALTRSIKAAGSPIYADLAPTASRVADPQTTR